MGRRASKREGRAAGGLGKWGGRRVGKWGGRESGG